MEALVTRSPGTVDADAVGLEAQSALRFLNAIFEEAPPARARQGRRRVLRALGEGFAGLSRLFPETEGGPEVLAWVAAALAGLGEAPTASATMGTVLRILRTNTPLPSGHPAPPGAGRDAGRSHGVGALIVDKAIQVVLATSSARWRTSRVDPIPRAPRQSIELGPSTRARGRARRSEQAASRPRGGGRAPLRAHRGESRAAAVPGRRAHAELFLTPYRRTALGSARPEAGEAHPRPPGSRAGTSFTL